MAKIDGDESDNDLTGGDKDDRIRGFGGDDTLTGAGGADRISAGSGDDQLFGDAGKDSLNGGEGDDQLFGGAGNDQLIGDVGKDVLQGGAGNDFIFGGQGADRFVFEAGDGKDQIGDFSLGNDKIVLDIAGVDSFQDLNIKETDNGYSLITWEGSNGQSILVRLSPEDLHKGDFIFGGDS